MIILTNEQMQEIKDLLGTTIDAVFLKEKISINDDETLELSDRIGDILDKSFEANESFSFATLIYKAAEAAKINKVAVDKISSKVTVERLSELYNVLLKNREAFLGIDRIVENMEKNNYHGIESRA